MRIAEKWAGRMPGVGIDAGTWEQRARRGEAERDAARVIDYSNSLVLRARLREVERALEETTQSISWRITAPFRWLARLRAPAGG
jgi:hypothetical protein